MIKANLSEKGKALIKNKRLCAVLAKAITGDREMKLYSKEGLKVKYNGKTITLKA